MDNARSAGSRAGIASGLRRHVESRLGCTGSAVGEAAGVPGRRLVGRVARRGPARGQTDR
jgi:hypothetical protein